MSLFCDSRICRRRKADCFAIEDTPADWVRNHHGIRISSTSSSAKRAAKFRFICGARNNSRLGQRTFRHDVTEVTGDLSTAIAKDLAFLAKYGLPIHALR